MNGRLLDGKKYEKVSVNSGLNKFFCYICGLKCLKCETPKKLTYMIKGVNLLAVAVCMASTVCAQEQLADTLKTQDDNSDFTFTESQLDEDMDAAQTVSSVVSSKSDPYLAEVGYLFSPMRFRVRAYDNMYNQTYMNGLMLNDLETGRFSYGLIGGMNDAVRNKEGVSGFEYNNFGLTGVGGGTSINTRASQFAQGSKLALSGCNRNYTLRGMFTHATGLMDNGWALAGSIGYRWAKEGVIEGTFYNSFSYFLSAEKRFGDNHSLSLVTFGSPTERAQQGASTEEAYWLANSHYYNPNWGYQNGKKRNARVVESFEPTSILTWDWDIKDGMKLTTAAGFKYSMYSTSALGWNGDAYDPRPDYYKNMPSSIFDVYDPEKNNPEYLAQNPFLLEEYEELKNYWLESKANRQINWDRMYYVNRQNEAEGGEALYYQERRHNDQMVFALNSTLNHIINKQHKYVVGLQLNTTKGMHYKTMDDLLGGTRYVDVDKFAANDYGPNSPEAQNDLNNPNRRIGVGDKFGYNYNIYVNKARLWTMYQYSQPQLDINLGAHVEGTTMERDGLMRNGRAAENSYGKSGQAKFFGGGVKGTLTWRPLANHRITYSWGYESQAPLARNSFVAPRIQNNFVNNLTNEDILSGELSYAFRFGSFSGKVSGYYTKFLNQVEQTAYFNDQQSTFTYLTMSGVEKEHYGLEGALMYQVNSNLSFNVIGSISEAKYTNNPYAQINYEGMDGKEIYKLNRCVNPVTKEAMPLRVIADGIHVGSTPLTAVSVGANYNINNWFFEAALNYYDRVYVGFSQYRRLNSTYGTAGKFYTPTSVDANGNKVYEVTANELKENGGILFDNEGNVVKEYAAEQEKFDGGFMLDLSIGRYIRLAKGRSLSINLSLSNVLNNCDMRTGGYEQNRDDNYYKESGGQYSKGEAKAYKFSKNSKYYYANAFNFFLNIGYKF